jgi:hypothetical protein
MDKVGLPLGNEPVAPIQEAGWTFSAAMDRQDRGLVTTLTELSEIVW